MENYQYPTITNTETFQFGLPLFLSFIIGGLLYFVAWGFVQENVWLKRILNTIATLCFCALFWLGIASSSSPVDPIYLNEANSSIYWGYALLFCAIGCVIAGIYTLHKIEEKIGGLFFAPAIVLGAFGVILVSYGMNTGKTTISNGTYPLIDTELSYIPGTTDPSEVTINGKTEKVDAIKVDLSAKDPVVIVSDNGEVTIVVPSRNYFDDYDK